MIYKVKNIFKELGIKYPFPFAPLKYSVEVARIAKNQVINLREYYRKVQHPMGVKFINIELTSVCNLRCTTCGLDQKKRKTFTDPVFFKELLFYIVDNPEISSWIICLQHAGESLLHPQFLDLMEIVGDVKKGKKGLPTFMLFTNGTKMDESYSKSILKNLDYLHFSVDGGNKEDFEKMRVGAIWEEVLGNIELFLELRDKINPNFQVHINCIKKLGSKNTYAREFTNITRRITGFRVIDAHAWDGMKKVEHHFGNKMPAKKGLCCMIESGLVVLSDKRVVPCGVDLNATTIIGDLSKETLLDVWLKSEKRHEMIRLMKQGRRQEIPLCRVCIS
jgi:hypothetical protein